MAMDNVEDIYPLSPMQEGMLFHVLAANQTGVYVEQVSCFLKTATSLDKFRDAWKQVVRRHAVLRTAFVWEGIENPLQIVRNTAEPT